METGQRVGCGGFVGLAVGLVGGALYGYFDNSEPAPIVSPAQLACIGAGFFAPIGFVAGLFVGGMVSVFWPPNDEGKELNKP
jgi:hypothetical protein